MVNILVTGGAGFIGYNLTLKLLASPENKVVCLDNLCSSNPSNLQKLRGYDNFTFIEQDISKNIDYNQIIIKYITKIDYIYHLACPASPQKYQFNPLKTFQTCVKGTHNILKVAKYHNAKLIMTSTSEVYGDPNINPQHESYNGNVNLHGDRSCYDEGKRAAETLIHCYRIKYPHLDLKIVRLFNTYGPGMSLDDGRVITNFIKSVINDQPLTIYGTGHQTRSFCYIDDIISGLMLMMASSHQGPINLGNPSQYLSINDVIPIFNHHCHNLKVNYIEALNDDPKIRQPDITTANQELGWHPSIDIHQGIDNTFKYFTT